MKGLFLAKRGQRDTLTGISFLSTCVRNPTESDWNKLIKLASYLKNRTKMKLGLEADGTRTLKWFIDLINSVRRMTYMYRIWVNNYVPISYVIVFSSQEDLFLFFFKLYFNLLPL